MIVMINITNWIIGKISDVIWQHLYAFEPFSIFLQMQHLQQSLYFPLLQSSLQPSERPQTKEILRYRYWYSIYIYL